MYASAQTLPPHSETNQVFLLWRNRNSSNPGLSWKIRSGTLGCHKLSARSGKCVSYWSVRTKSTIDSFCDEARDSMEEIYQHDAKVLSPRMHGRAKDKLRRKATRFVIVVFSRSFVVVLRPGKFDSQFIIQQLWLQHAGGSLFFIIHYYLSVSLSSVEKDF